MATIEFVKFGPIISDKIIGDEIYALINKSLQNHQQITLDLSGIISMATFCAKQIFGKLYLLLTPEVFFERIILTNVSADVKLIIKIGIQNAIEEIQKKHN